MNLCSCKGMCRCTNCKCGKYAGLFETLGNHNRIRILHALRKQSLSVSDLIANTGLEQTCISHSLRKLEESRFVTAKREGKFRIYSVNTSIAEPLLALIDKHVEDV